MNHLPRWRLDSVFPALDSAEFQAAFDEVAAGIRRFGSLVDKAPAEGGQTVSWLEKALDELNDLEEKLTSVNAYLYALTTTDARIEAAQTRQSELQIHLAEMTKAMTAFTAWVGTVDIDHAAAASKTVGKHEFLLRKMAERSRHQMTAGEENLAADLNLSGIESWAKLHGRVTALLTAEVTMPSGETKTLPMSVARALAHDPDPAVRRAAYDGELRAWESAEVPLSAALNGIKGATNVLNRGRSWASALEPSLFDNNTDLATLEAMQAAVVESFPDFRRYLKAKARLLGAEKLAWWDLYAPVTGSGQTRRWSYDEAAGFIREHFGAFSKRLDGLAARAFDEGWVDAEPREGKQQGGYCMTIKKEESRVFVNFEPSFDALQTLAHELGHAYHHFVIAERPPLQRITPMALAETASTFCQTIVFNAALQQASGVEKLGMLESSLSDACTYAVDIHGRFLFEKTLFERREERELPVEELKSIILEAEKETYGDALEDATLHPYMWASKVHYYLPDSSFYNWPYTFGMLFSMALYRKFSDDPAGFVPEYDRLLADTGVATPAELASRFSLDVRSPAFWRSSLDVVRQRISQFEEAAEGLSQAQR